MDIESNTILNIIKYIIVVIGFCLGWNGYLYSRKLRPKRLQWVVVGLIIMGVYWSLYYVQSIFGGLVVSHQIWVRSPILITLSLIALLFWLLRRYK